MKKLSSEIAIKLTLFTLTLSALVTIFLYQSYYQNISEMNISKGLIQIGSFASQFNEELEHSALAVGIARRFVEEQFDEIQPEQQNDSVRNISNQLKSQFALYIQGHSLVKSLTLYWYPDDSTRNVTYSYSVMPDGTLTEQNWSLTDAVLRASRDATWRSLFESSATGKWSDLYNDENGDQFLAYSSYIQKKGQRICLIVAELKPAPLLATYAAKDSVESGQYLLLDSEQIAYSHTAITHEKAEEILAFTLQALGVHQHTIYQIDREGRYLGVISPVNDKWWLLGLYVKDDLKAYAHYALFPWIVILISILLFIIVALYFFTSGLTRPLKELTGSIMAYEDIGKRFEIPTMIKRSHNEFSILANAVHGLIERIGQFGEKVEFQNQELIDEINAKEKMIKDLSIASKIIDSAHEGVCIADKNFKISYVNDMFEQITGFSREEVMGLDISILDPGGSQLSKNIYEELRMFSIWSGFVKQLKKDGSLYDQKLTLRTIADQSGEVDSYIATFDELLDMPLMTADHRMYDPLTGLITKETLIKEFGLRTELKEQKMALLLLGIDNFRAINQTMGHEIGDDILRRLTSRIINAVPVSSSVIARFGGDEFAILTEHYSDRHQLTDLAENLLAITNEPFIINSDKIFITSSVGICLYPDDAGSVDELFKRVTSALHVAKESGRKTFKFFSRSELELVNRRIKLMSTMHEGWKNKEFYIVYQPKLDLQTERVIGAEALMRWKSSTLGEVSPAEFIPIAEELGLISQMGVWSIFEAAARVAQIQSSGVSPFRLSVNLSYYQLLDEEILTTVKEAISSHHIRPESFELEITESILMTNLKHARGILTKLKALGVMISVDDFGTGYSSLSYLKNLPIDILKIDRSFIKDIPQDDGTIAKIIIQLAESLKMQVIAEGVETIEQIEFLKQNHCLEAQGYFYAKPLEFIDFIGYCSKQNKERHLGVHSE